MALNDLYNLLVITIQELLQVHRAQYFCTTCFGNETNEKINLASIWLKQLFLTDLLILEAETFNRCLLLVTFCSLLVTFCSFLVTFDSLLVTFDSLLVAFARCLLLFTRWSLVFTRCSLALYT